MRWGGNIDGKRYKGLENIDEDINRKILEREKRKKYENKRKKWGIIDRQTEKRKKYIYTKKKSIGVKKRKRKHIDVKKKKRLNKKRKK